MPDNGKNRASNRQSPGPRNNPQPGDQGSGQDPNGQGGAGGPKPPLGRGSMGWIVLIVISVTLLMLFQSIGPHGKQVTWREFESFYKEGALTEVVIDERSVFARGKPGSLLENQRIEFEIPTGAKEHIVAKVEELTAGDYLGKNGPPVWQQVLFSPLLATMIILIVIWFFLLRGLRAAGGAGGVLGNFGKSRHRVQAKQSTGITFADVAGIDEAKDEVSEIVEFLKHPKKFMRLGGRIPRGVLLVGDPGCGKTLLAKAIAGEADVPFFSISGSDFVEMFVGVGASRVRDLFKQAKESSPCIIFLDEIDAVGRRRGGGFTTGGHDEREQTLNAILVEMDGFESSDQVIVIAATNRSDVLDPALTRPGRFDRQVIVPLPDLKGRLEILQVHAKKVKLGPDVNLERIARGTPMFSGAELAAIINEAAIAATLSDKEWVDQDDLEEARDKIRYGRSRKSRVIEEKERIATAYHEAGHAVLQLLLPETDPLHKVTIIPRGQSLGATFSLPEKDRYGFGAKWIKSTMRMVCGGRIAEQRKTGDISSGAAMDITQLTRLARHMVLEWGMSEKLGFVRYSGVDNRETFIPEREYSEDTARMVDEEIRRYADEAYREAERLIVENWDKVEAVAKALLAHETLTADEVKQIMGGRPLHKPTVSELLAEEARKQQPPPAVAPPMKRPESDSAGPGLMPQPA
ncbi:MAG TPA: ATP-dependent zinc metalloprotease FtsH [Phycisphaerales bacterium]|nr:ATP-dependent zinc metalloprotease FtsH [Phycisphaerales bacterium]